MLVKAVFFSLFIFKKAEDFRLMDDNH